MPLGKMKINATFLKGCVVKQSKHPLKRRLIVCFLAVCSAYPDFFVPNSNDSRTRN